VESPNSGGAPDRPPRPPGPVDEFSVIARLRARFEASARLRAPGGDLPPVGDIWIGDDAAVVGLASGVRAVMATDLVVGGVHVDTDLSGPEDIGYKALMVTVSDFAAMGVRPAYALVSVAAPPGTDLDALGDGLAEAAEEAACVVVGGDLSEAPLLVVSTAVVGVADPGGPDPLLRSGARPGHRLFVTGPLGRSAAGMRILRSTQPGGEPHERAPDLARAHRRPVARLAEGEASRRSGASAAIDLSDGLVADLSHLAGASGVGVDLDAVPVAEGASREEALSGGEDYELLVATDTPDELVAAFASAGLALPLPIGVCTAHVGHLTLEGVDLPPGGWRHRF
jgi:thiamine-monophosphate kinase